MHWKLRVVRMRMGFDGVKQFYSEFIDDLHIAIEGFEDAIDDSALTRIAVDQQVGIGAAFAVEQLFYGELGSGHCENFLETGGQVKY